jgi:hypothetical protein
MEKTKLAKHTGSCHCGQVRFEVECDPSAGATRCNCSVCNKLNSTGLRATMGTLKVLAGESALTAYKTSSASRFFCSHCGCHLYGAGYVAEIGGEFLSVNVQALDDVDPSTLTIGYFDGRHDNWQAGLRPAPWPIFTA